MNDDLPEDAMLALELDVNTLVRQMASDGVHDAWASYQTVVLRLTAAFDPEFVAELRDRATRFPHEAEPAEFVASLRRGFTEGVPYTLAVVALWVDLEHSGVSGDRIPGLLLEAADRVWQLTVEREAFEAAG